MTKEKGLIPKGEDPARGKGTYIDPVTGEQRIISQPDSKSGPHGHVNDPKGNRIGPDGKVVDDDAPEAHVPIKKDKK